MREDTISQTWGRTSWHSAKDLNNRGFDISRELTIDFVSREKQNSDYDWANIVVGDHRIGKARRLINGSTITVYTIMIFPEFEGNVYGRQFIGILKKSFDTIIADRVRYKAIGFWTKMGFGEGKDGSFVYRKKMV